MRLFKRCLKITSISFFSLLLFCIALLIFLLFTHSGTQLILKTAIAFESRLTIELREGALLDAPHFENITWIDGETSIQINSLDYQFYWPCLFNKLCLKSLTADGIQVQLADPSSTVPIEEDPENSAPLAFNLPFELIIENINVTQLNFKMGELAINLKQFSLQANAFNNNISLATQIDGLLIKLADSEASPVVLKKINTSAKKQRDLTIKSLPAILTHEMLPTVVLPVNLNINPIVLTNLTVEQNKQTIFTLNQLQTAFTFKQSQLSVSQFSLDLPETALNLTAKINFIDDYPLELSIDGKLKNVKQLQPENLLADMKYQLSSQGRLSDLTSELILSNKIDLQLKNHIDLFAENLVHSIELNWQNLAWPLVGKTQYSSKQGRFTSKGSLANHHINFETDYAIAELPSGKLTLKTEGDLQQLQIETLKIETLGGDIDFSGLLTWKDKIDWLGQLAITNIDLQEFESAYDGQFSGIVKQQVAVTLYENSDPEWQFNFPELNINGELLEQPVSVAGKIFGDDKQGITFEDLIINNAKNSIVIDGLFAQQNDLNISLDIVDLSQAVLESRGEIRGEIKLKGPQEALNISSQLVGKGLYYQKYNIENITLDSELILAEKPQLKLNLQADTLTVEKQLIDQIDITVSNKNSAEGDITHQIALQLNSELISTDLMLFLTQTDSALLTQLHQARLHLPYQTLTLDGPFEVTSAQNNIQLSAHCWKATNENSHETREKKAGKLCIKEFNVGESGEVIFEINNYLLANANPFLPEQFKMAGAISADANLKWEKKSKPDFTVALFSDDMLFKINSDQQSQSFVDYPMKSFKVDIKGSKEQIDINTNIISDNLIDVQFKGHLLPYKQQPSIDGKVAVNLPDFSLFIPLIPQLELLKGALNSDLTITGELKEPTINGQINIENGEISSAALPMKIAELRSRIEIKNSKATLQGSFNSSDSNTITEKVAEVPLLTDTLNVFDKSVKKVKGKIIDGQEGNVIKVSQNDPQAGKATIKGQFDWSNKLKGSLHLYAHKLEVYDYGKIDLILSPDINIVLNEHVKVTGKLFIDKGKIVVEEVPDSAISQSKDIIVIDVEKEKIVSDLPISIDVSVNTGKKFQLIALGLDTFIEGNLFIKKRLKKDLTIHGKLMFSDGSYRSFGQKLVLQKSSVNFQGAPESPYLKIEAIRDPSKIKDNVIAGVRVTGTPDELEMIIFSKPAMAQQEALSYLTRGRSIDSSSEDGGTMANMLIDIAADQSDGLMSSIGEEFGIKDLSLSSSGTGDDQSVGVRGEIAPGIEISYGVGVFDSFSIFSIRYEMFERFYIEASSGIDQAVDAYYEWDWD